MFCSRQNGVTLLVMLVLFSFSDNGVTFLAVLVLPL